MESGHEATMDAVLQRRVAELETTLARDASKFQRAITEHEKLVTQLLTARKNNDILCGNIEALKALATQLANQLEDTRNELATVKDAADANDLKLRRDAATELVNFENAYETRLDNMRKAVEEQQGVVDRLMDSQRDVDIRTEIEVARVATAKDLIIAELRQELDVLKCRLDYVETTKRRTADNAATLTSLAREQRTPSPVRRSSHTPRRRQQRAGDAPVGNDNRIASAGKYTSAEASMLLPSQRNSLHRPSQTAWDTASESEISAANRAVVDVKICVSKEDFYRAKWRTMAALNAASGSAATPPSASMHGGPSRYHIDVTTDGTFVDAVPFRELPPSTPSGEELFQRLAMGITSPTKFAPPRDNVTDGVRRERCAFLSATGEEIRVQVEVLPMVPGGFSR
jgi:hypothetical protein